MILTCTLLPDQRHGDNKLGRHRHDVSSPRPRFPSTRLTKNTHSTDTSASVSTSLTDTATTSVETVSDTATSSDVLSTPTTSATEWTSTLTSSWHPSRSSSQPASHTITQPATTSSGAAVAFHADQWKVAAAAGAGALAFLL